MQDISDSDKRIAKNTLMLYIRMVLVLLITLYTSRVVLNVLGVDDFGLYSVVGSVVTFLGFLNTSMAAAAQRFLAFAKGQKNDTLLADTFNSIVRVQLIIALIVLLLCETIGIYYISHYLNVEQAKIFDAHIVFQFSIASFIFNTITVPYNASIIANERMDIFALFSILEVILKLGISISLPLFRSHTLIWYAFFMFISSCLIREMYAVFCRRVFLECKVSRISDRSIIKKILTYSGWNLLGAFSAVATDQGVNMILNSFCGLVVNAARGISFQVSGAMSQLYSNFQQALNPQIVKSYAANDKHRMHFLIMQGTRLAFFLLFVCALPIIFNIDGVLKLWLVEVPKYTSMFCVLVIINSLINTLSQSMLMGAMATGNIKKYQIVVSFINLMNLPLSYIALKISANPYLTVYIMIVLSLIAFCARLILLHQMIDISIPQFLRKAIFPVIISVIVASILAICIDWILPYTGDISRLVIRILLLFILSVAIVVKIGTSKEERQILITYLKKKLNL